MLHGDELGEFPEVLGCGGEEEFVVGTVRSSQSEARDDSDIDIDIAVEIESGRSFSLIRMEDTRLLLEDALGYPVDLGEVESFRSFVRAAFEQDQVRVF